MVTFLKWLRVVDVLLGLFLIVGIGVLVIVQANNWSRYWPLSEGWNWLLLSGAIALYGLTRILSWTFASSLTAHAQLSPNGSINRVISGLVVVGIVALLAVFVNILSAFV